MDLVNPLRKHDLGTLVDLQNLDVVLIQETMGEGIEIACEFSKLLKDWKLLVVDSI
jgi:hypothetical protein